MNYTETLKLAAGASLIKNFTKMPMEATLDSVFTVGSGYHPFMDALKGNHKELGRTAFKTASAVTELELANKYLRKASIPGAITSLPTAIGAAAGALAFGALGHHFWKTIEPDVKGANVDDLYRKLSSIEPEITNYPKLKAKHYMEILLEHSKILSTKPRIFASILTRVLPFPTFPYEQLSNMDKITGADDAGRTANIVKGMSSAAKLLGA